MPVLPASLSKNDYLPVWWAFYQAFKKNVLQTYMYTVLRVLLQEWDHIILIFPKLAFFTHQIPEVSKFYLYLATLVVCWREKG